MVFLLLSDIGWKMYTYTHSHTGPTVLHVLKAYEAVCVGVNR